MTLTLDRALAWLTAFAVVFSLYAHTVLGMDSSAITPLSAAAIAAGLLMMSGLWFIRARLAIATTGFGVLASFCLVAALGLGAISGIAGAIDKGVSLNDTGLLLLLVGVPVLVYANSDRASLLTALGWWCAAFALVDAAANMGAVAGFWTLQDAGAIYTDAGRVARFGGLTGNSHASGVVALIGVAYIARHRLSRRPLWKWAATGGALLAIAASLLLIDARRYLGEALLLSALLLVPWARLLPLQLASAAAATAGLIFTWQSTAPEEIQRVALMAAGWRDAADHLVIGEGVIYRTPTGSDFNGLWASRVTESGVLDLAIQLGWAATVLLIGGALLALRGSRKVLPWPAALLAVMIGELAYGNPLEGFVGAVTFYAALVWVICDELTPSPGTVRTAAAAAFI